MSYLKQSSYVYFIRAKSEFEEYVKVGVAYSPQKRLVGLQVGCPLELEIIGVIPEGGYKLEKEIHKDLANDLERGEWFRVTPKIIPWLKKLEPPPTGDEPITYINPIRVKQLDNGGFCVWDLRKGTVLGKFVSRGLADRFSERLAGLGVDEAAAMAESLWAEAKEKAGKGVAIT